MLTSPSTAIANVRGRCHATTASYSDTIGIKHYNYAYEDVTCDIQLLDEEYFFNYGESATVANQIEYTITTMNTGTVMAPIERDITRVKNVLVKYTADQEYFTKLKQVWPDYLTYGKDWHAVNQVEPIYFIQDNSIWIFPATTTSLANWIRVEAILQPDEVEIADASSTILVPRRISRIIEDGMMPYAYEYLGKEEKVPWAIQIYDKRKKEALEQIKVRDSGVYKDTNAIQHNLR